MRASSDIKHTVLHFKKFSNKGFAAFSSLGNVVHICRLAISLCEQAILKSSDVVSDCFSLNSLNTPAYDDDYDDDIVCFTEPTLLLASVVSSSSEVYRVGSIVQNSFIQTILFHTYCKKNTYHTYPP